MIGLCYPHSTLLWLLMNIGNLAFRKNWSCVYVAVYKKHSLPFKFLSNWLMCVKHQVILSSFWDWDFLWGSPTPVSGPDMWYYMKNKATEIHVIISSLLSPLLMWHFIQHHYHPNCYLLFCVYICFGKKICYLAMNYSIHL